MNKRIAENETGLTQVGGRVSNVEGQVQSMAAQIADLNSRLKQTDAKADRALDNMQRLKIDRKLVLDMKQGAFFTSNSTVLNDVAKKEIDSFLSDLRGDTDATSSFTFVVAGHTDDIGTDKYNYDLARLRAENTASYLTTNKKIDPGSLSVLSYGKRVSVADNRSETGRAKNRRVEILVYRETIAVGGASNEKPAAR